jgi:hypothetical protein
MVKSIVYLPRDTTGEPSTTRGRNRHCKIALIAASSNSPRLGAESMTTGLETEPSSPIVNSTKTQPLMPSLIAAPGNAGGIVEIGTASPSVNVIG